MKKLLTMAVLACSAVGFAANGLEVNDDPTSPVHDECVLSWWSGAPKANLQKDLRGTVIGLGSGFKSVRGAQLSLCMNEVEELKGGAQIAIGYNYADKARNGCQIAVVNQAKSAALQFGVLCFNENGFLPFFILFNFDKTAFGSSN